MRPRIGTLVDHDLGFDPGVPEPSSADDESASSRMVFRTMREDPPGSPMIGPTARTLGVRPDVDIPLIDGKVRPGTGGLSVAPDDPMKLPAHRRPPSLGGTGKDPVWGIRTDSVGGEVVFRQDKANHGLFEPAREMSIEDFNETLAGLAPKWVKQ